MHPSHPSPRRRRAVPLGAEALESRQLLTGGQGDTFALFSGTIAKANQPVAVKFTIDPANFHLPNGKMTLGIDVATPSGSTLQPMIRSVNDAQGHLVGPTTHSTYAPNLPNLKAGQGLTTTAVLTPVSFKHANADGTVTYTVNVTGLHGTTGNFLLGFYLPGDANGDGVVDNTDVQAVKNEMGARGGDTRYTFDADVNRDGRINQVDLRTTMQNLGASTTISPVATANLDPASDTGLQDRTTTLSAVHFSGVASPGAAVKYQATDQATPPVTTAADASGHYSLNVPLAPGVNTFRVTTADGFGQSISGTIAPVSYQATPPASQSQLDALKSLTAPPTSTG